MQNRSYSLEDTYEIEDLTPPPPRRSCCAKFLRFLIDNWFMLSTILGVIIGFGVGFVLQKKDLSHQAKIWLDMPGKLYIRVLQLTILPMIVANIITVLASLNPKGNGKMCSITIACLIICNLLSSLIGLTLGLLILPSSFFKASTPLQESKNDPVKLAYIFRDLLLNIFPENLVSMAISQTMTNISEPLVKDGETIYITKEIPGTNMIGVLFCSIAFGIATNATKAKGAMFKDFFSSLGDIVMYLMTKFLLITPICVMFMVMSSVANVEEDLGKTFGALALFVGVNFIGQVVHLILMMLSTVCLRENPFKMFRYSLPPYFIGFATTSAIISLPKCYDSCDKYGMPKSVSRFVLPIAGTMKSDASAIFIVSAVFYTALDSNISLDVGKMVIVVILATVYVSALPNIPSSSMVVTTTILCSIGIGPEKAMILFAVEFINDRLRSGNIVFSHLYCAVFVYHACKNDIEEQVEDGNSPNKLEETNRRKYAKEKF
nr:excitatory amino acid transporter 1 [Hymenolepis microstoma]